MSEEVITKPEDCLRFNICDANLCPYDTGLKNRVWFPDETVCAKQNMTEEYPWIKLQRKIAKKCQEPDKYFVLGMLENLSSVRKGIVGLNPDVDYQVQLNSWLKDHHKTEKQYTEEEKRTLIERLQKGRKLKKVNLKGQATFNFSF